MTVEERLAAWKAQDPAVCRITPAERDFIDDMRHYARLGVGFGWMKQIIDWEWAAVHPETFPGEIP